MRIFPVRSPIITHDKKSEFSKFAPITTISLSVKWIRLSAGEVDWI